MYKINNQVKYTFMVVIAFYMCWVLINIKDDMYLKRRIQVENRELHGVVIINNQKLPVPYRALQTMLPVQITSPWDFLLLSSSRDDDSLVNDLLKIALCIIVGIVFWNFDFKDPFAIRHATRIRRIFVLLCMLFFMEAIKNIYTADWCENASNGVGDFRYVKPSDFYYLIVPMWIIQLVLPSYQKAVKTQQDQELTI